MVLPMFGRLHPNVKALLVTSGFLSLAMGVSYPFLSEYIYTITGSAFTAGLVASVRSIVCVFFLVLGGYLADAIGRKRPIWIGTILLGLSQLLYASVKTPYGFFAAAICEGVSYFYFPAFNAMIMDSTSNKRLVNVFTLALIVDHLPYMVSPVLGGFLRDFYGVEGLRFGFGLGGLVTMILGIARWRLLTETVKEAKRVDAGMLTTAYRDVVRDFQNLNLVVKRLILLRSFLLLSGISMFYYFAVLYAVRYAAIVSFTEWGLIMALSSASYLLTLPLTKHTGRLSLAFFYAFLTSLEGLAIVIFLLNMKFALLASMVLLNICGALTYAVERAVVARATEQAKRGRAESFMNLSFYLGSALGSYLGGLMYAWHPPFMLVLASALLMVGAGFGCAVFRGVPKIG